MLKLDVQAAVNDNGDQPPSGGCVLKQEITCKHLYLPAPAAFGRLCVETSKNLPSRLLLGPAAFGRLCVETIRFPSRGGYSQNQPPSGGCVLKRQFDTGRQRDRVQPPSGGCVLKLFPAVSGYLSDNQPPSGGCVLKRYLYLRAEQPKSPAAFGRLCVETSASLMLPMIAITSRLRAAVC